MLFTDPLFLFYFLPATLVGLRLAAVGGRLNALVKTGIILATLVFYAHENWLWVLVFLAVAIGTYACGWALTTTHRPWVRRLWLGTAVFYCVFLLSAFKYLNWLTGLLPQLEPVRDWIVPWFGSNGAIVLPPGISFYVFEAISYCFDIYRRRIRSPANPIDFLCFIAMFPRFIAGPIVRYADLAAQIKGWAGMRISKGLTLFAIGFSMKSLLADQFAIFVPYAFNVPQPDFLQAWTGVASYSCQLYFDFWAYSIMATGLGLCLGFEFPDNFRSPYHALSITQFWRRWHISLSTWLRDYLYIPLGGNRVAEWRTDFNLFITMAIGGLWHGANFTFIVWGVYHGLLLIVERRIGEARLALVNNGLRHGITLLLVAVGWTIFRSANLEQALAVLRGMTGLNGLTAQFNSLLIEKNLLSTCLTVFGLVFLIFGEKRLIREQPLAQQDFPVRGQWVIWGIFLAALLMNASNSEIPFLYFQF